MGYRDGLSKLVVSERDIEETKELYGMVGSYKGLKIERLRADRADGV